MIDTDRALELLHECSSIGFGYDVNPLPHYQILKQYLPILFDYIYQQGFADATRWIPCSERLPEIGVCVLVAELIDDKCYCGLGNMKDNGVWCISIQTPDFPDGNIQGNEVIAWMPLPEAYKEEV